MDSVNTGGGTASHARDSIPCTPSKIIESLTSFSCFFLGQGQPKMALERFNDFLRRFLTEILDFQQIVLGVVQQVSNRIDLGAFETVVISYRKLQLLDMNLVGLIAVIFQSFLGWSQGDFLERCKHANQDVGCLRQ